MCHLQGDKMYNVHFLQVNGNYRAYLCEKIAKEKCAFLGGFVQKCTLFRAAKQHIFADIAACYMKCAICHKIIRYIGIIYLSECDIWHMLCVKKLHTAIKSLWG